MRQLAALLALGFVALGCGSGPMGDPASAPVPCVGCHLDDYASARPPHPGKKPTRCEICHRQSDWHPVQIKHDAFALTGKHGTTDCYACHRGQAPRFEGTPSKCVGCHADALARENAAAPWHEHFADTCADCHQTQAWRPAKSEPGFSLRAEPHAPVVAPVKKPAVVRTPVKRPPRRPGEPVKPDAPVVSDVPDVPDVPEAPHDPGTPDTPDVSTGATRRRR